MLENGIIKQKEIRHNSSKLCLHKINFKSNKISHLGGPISISKLLSDLEDPKLKNVTIHPTLIAPCFRECGIQYDKFFETTKFNGKTLPSFP